MKAPSILSLEAVATARPAGLLRHGLCARSRIAASRLACLALLVGASLSFVPLCAALPGSWALTGELNIGRVGHGATLLTDGKVLIEGGGGAADVLPNAEIYNPVTRSWITTESMNFARTNHVATLLNDGRVLVAGGYNYPDNLTSAEIYNPVRRTWRTTGSLVVGRRSPAWALLPDGKVLVTGGLGGGASAELYDPASGTWSLTGSMTASRDSHTMTLLPSGKVLAVGGAGVSAELYDPATGVWTPTGSLNFARESHTATLLADGRVLVAGGKDRLAVPTAELYDPATGIWTTTGNMITPRYVHTAVLQNDGTVLVAGGYDPGLVSTEIYDPATGIWTSTGAMADELHSHTMTLLLNGTTLVAGGSAVYGGVQSDAELYTPGFAEATSVSGQGFVTTPTGTASFNMNVSIPDGQRQPVGYLHFTDTSGNVIISDDLRFRSLVFDGNTATLSGKLNLEKGGSLTFSVVAIDNSSDGSSDSFTITLSNGYSAGGLLEFGNIIIE